MANPNTPVIVGVAQFKHRIETLDEAIEPLEMMLEACRRAEVDTGVHGVLRQAESVRVIRGIWFYANPARYVAEKFGATSAQTVGTLIGGNHVQLVVNLTAQSIQAGALDLAVITGAENGYSSGKARREGVRLPVTETPGAYDLVIGAQQPEHHEYEIAKGIRTPIQVYPMYENAIRHRSGESLDRHMARVSELWSRFSEVAERNPHAWIRERMSPETIRTPSPANRQISVPYPKLMNANNAVDMSAALILCSLRKARELGIAEERFVYPLAGTAGKEQFSASVRDNFYSSPGIRMVGKRALEMAGVEASGLDYVDLYSCFPCAVQVAATELGIPSATPLTVTGGLTFMGGPLNNYAMHGIATMAELLRSAPGATGLCTAQGGNLYKHAHGIYSSAPPEGAFEFVDLQEELDRIDGRECLASHRGEVTVESYTAMFREERPAIGHFACLTPDGARVWANSEDPDLLQAMTSEEFCGRTATLDAEGGIKIRS